MGEPSSRGGEVIIFLPPLTRFFKFTLPSQKSKILQGCEFTSLSGKKFWFYTPQKGLKKPIYPPFTDKNLIYPPQKFPKISTPPCIPLLIFWGKIPPRKDFQIFTPTGSLPTCPCMTVAVWNYNIFNKKIPAIEHST